MSIISFCVVLALVLAALLYPISRGIVYMFRYRSLYKLATAAECDELVVCRSSETSKHHIMTEPPRRLVVADDGAFVSHLVTLGYSFMLQYILKPKSIMLKRDASHRTYILAKFKEL